MDIKFKKLSPDAIIPTKAHASDIGLDLYAAEDAILYYGEVVKINTKIACSFPKGIAGLILDRSSMGSKGYKVFGGVIDQAYTGELIVCLSYLKYYEDYEERRLPPIIKKGDKIAQLVLIPSYEVSIIEVDELGETDRGNKGFGSSGA
jgi:dUTP pyrophosphatase